MATLKARKIYGDDRHTVVVVESVDVRQKTSDDAFGLLAWSKPFAVVILAAGGTHAVDMNAKPLDLGRLLNDAEGLSALLAR